MLNRLIQFDEITAPEAIRHARIITTARVFIDAIVSIGTFFILQDAPIDPIVSTSILSSVLAILLTSVIGWLLVVNGSVFIGLGVSIYGLTFGLFTVSIYIQGFGFFTLVVLNLLVALSVATTVPQKRASQAILVSVIMGISALLLDIFLGSRLGPQFSRISLPDGFTQNLWIILTVLIIIFLSTVWRQFYRFSLKIKLVSSFMFVTLVSLGLLGYLNNQNILQALTVEAQEGLFAAATQTKNNIQSFLDSTIVIIRNEANLPSLITYLQLTPEERNENNTFDQISSTLTVLQAKNNNISSYALLDLEGNDLVDTVSNDIGSSKNTREYFIRTITSGIPNSSNVEFSPTTGVPSIYFSAPVLDSRGSVIGVLRARYDANILQELVEQSNGLVGPDSFGVLFDENFIHLAHGRKDEVDMEINFTAIMPLSTSTYDELVANLRLPTDVPIEMLYHDLPELNDNLLSTRQEDIQYFKATDPATGDRILQVVGIRFEENKPWLLTFFQPEDVFLSPVQGQTQTTTILALIIGGAVVGIALVLSNILLNPISRLTAAAEQISLGNLSVDIEAVTTDEIGLLTTTINSMAKQLGDLVTNLESQVEERTNTLIKRANQQQTAAEVARDTTRELEIDTLLDRAVNLICERFNFYHVGIYLTDLRKEYAVMAAGSDVPGQMLKDTGHRYKINTDTNVGYTAMIGEARMATDNDDAVLVTNHPLFPNTHSQIVIPLRIGNEIIGAIDIHSEDPDEFGENELVIFRTLADQLAISIQKNQLKDQSDRALKELETAYGLYTKKSWKGFAESTQKSLGYRYRQFNIEPITKHTDEVLKAWKKGETVIESQTGTPESPVGSSKIAIPMKVRGETIGILNLEFEGEQIPSESNQLIEELAERLSLILENARLVESAQYRVDQERMINEVSSKMRETLDMDNVIRSAIEGIGNSLGLVEVEVRMGLDDSSPTTTNGASGNGSSNSEKNK